ncbi:MAG: hypothetical protein ACOYMS_01360 [Terrimicrobiaceae bacterium]
MKHTLSSGLWTLVGFCTAVLLSSPLPAGEVKAKVAEADALIVQNPFNKLGKENVAVRVDATTKNPNFHGRGPRGFNVQIVGKNTGSAVMEFCYEVKPKGASSPSILLAGRGICSGTLDTFDVTIPGTYSPKEQGGWFVRVVKNGSVIGVAGSSFKFEEMAGKANTQVLYGGIQADSR